MTGIIKAQLDWIPLSIGAVRPTQASLAVMQVSGGSQSFNAVNQLRILERWMRMITIPINRPSRKPMSNSTRRGECGLRPITIAWST